jgi:hypothetical protein
MADGLIQQPVVTAIARLQGLPPPTVEPQPDKPREPSFQHAFLSTTLAGRGDKRLALAVVLLSALGFAVAVPFGKSPPYRIDAFIPPTRRRSR